MGAIGVILEKLNTPTGTKDISIAGTTMYVHSELANLRESASTDAHVVMQLKKGHQLVVLERDGTWYWVGPHRA